MHVSLAAAMVTAQGIYFFLNHFLALSFLLLFGKTPPLPTTTTSSTSFQISATLDTAPTDPTLSY